MDAINWHSCFFLLFAAAACLSAAAVVLCGDIVRMACFLVAALGAAAGLFFLAGADFLGAVQLMVYVGGTMVLLIFGVMLTARGPFVSIKVGGGQWILAVALGGALLVVLLQAAWSLPEWTSSRGGMTGPTAAPLGLGLMGIRVDQLEQNDTGTQGGHSHLHGGKIDSPSVAVSTAKNETVPGQLLPGHLLAFEIISIHLVVVLIGAAYLARARRGRPLAKPKAVLVGDEPPTSRF